MAKMVAVSLSSQTFMIPADLVPDLMRSLANAQGVGRHFGKNYMHNVYYIESSLEVTVGVKMPNLMEDEAAAVAHVSALENRTPSGPTSSTVVIEEKEDDTPPAPTPSDVMAEIVHQHQHNDN